MTKGLEYIEEEINRLNGLLSFIIEQQHRLDVKNETNTLNLIKIHATKIWCEKMIPRLEEKLDDINMKAVEGVVQALVGD